MATKIVPTLNILVARTSRIGILAIHSRSLCRRNPGTQSIRSMRCRQQHCICGPRWGRRRIRWTVQRFDEKRWGQEAHKRERAIPHETDADGKRTIAGTRSLRASAWTNPRCQSKPDSQLHPPSQRRGRSGFHRHGNVTKTHWTRERKWGNLQSDDSKKHQPRERLKFFKKVERFY